MATDLNALVGLALELTFGLFLFIQAFSDSTLSVIHINQKCSHEIKMDLPVVEYVASCANPEQEGAPVLDGALEAPQEVDHVPGDLLRCVGFVLSYKGYHMVDAVPGFTGAFRLRGQRPGQNKTMKK